MSDSSQKLKPIDVMAELVGDPVPSETSSGRPSNPGDSRQQSSVPVASRALMPPAAPSTNAALESLETAQTLFDSLNERRSRRSEPVFVPHEPKSLQEVGMSEDEIERLILKFLLARGATVGRDIAKSLCLPFGLLTPLLNNLKTHHLLAYRNSTSMGDYEYILTDLGRERAQRYMEECTYFGAAPVTLKDYVASVAAQTITKYRATEPDLRNAFADLIVNDQMLKRLGPAINSGRGMFLFGPAGNGKTSIAERVTKCFGATIYIPKAIGISGDIIRVYDPVIHETVGSSFANPGAGGLINASHVDTRWVEIRRPTVIAGGELTMEELEVKQNHATKICEAPMQMKSNCGTLVIDDFGRQRMPVVELLNRWIVPLEKRHDYLNLPCGKRVQVPFDQIIIFSTNLEPRDLVDAAFLRRIPYKISVTDPTLDEFHKLFAMMGGQTGLGYDKRAVDYLLAKHYAPVNRPLRACQPRDLLLQVKTYCEYLGQPVRLTPDAIDFACENYFSVM
jgi:DNA-binding PadR family transcriptional regulator